MEDGMSGTSAGRKYYNKGMVINMSTRAEDRDDNRTIIIRGGGDLATGVVQKFFRAGFNVLILEVGTPTAIRRGVALCDAVYDGTAKVEDVVCHRITELNELDVCWKQGVIPLLIDPSGNSIYEIKPAAVIDAIMAKRNIGTTRNMADITIALGPGFNAGEDVHAVIETQRGHDLGRLILSGYAKPDTGIPGEIDGESHRRVIYAPAVGVIAHKAQLGDVVAQGDLIFSIDGTQVHAPMSGLLRGLLREGLRVSKGMKVADIDSRTDTGWRLISDKARCIGGATLEAYFYLAQHRKG